MTPGFALSLSFEGIVLLARAAGGWRVAGRVSLAAGDLPTELADLRERAVQLSDPAFRTKLIVPNDQIRYLSVDTGHVATADRIQQVRNALDGATPYEVEDLVYDICVDGPMTHVAAVARDTLEEAEAFALEHRFNPVSFVAMPGDEAFLGEPFFGPTHFSEKALAAGERVEPDGVAVVIIGDLEEPAPQPPTAPTSQTEEAGAAQRDAGAEQTQTPPPTQDQTDTAEVPTPPVAVMPGFASRRARGRAGTDEAWRL